MTRPLLAVLVFLAGAGSVVAVPHPGGAGGRVVTVTSLADNPKRNTAGTLRWALAQKGPKIIRFAVGGDIVLRDKLTLREPFVTLDGSDAPAPGVTLRGASLMIRDTHDVVVRQIRIRTGEAPALGQTRGRPGARPRHSAGLDCVSLDDSRNILFDHCSLSWSCDEIFGIVRCREVEIAWCILAEPLAGANLHPYGDDHACAVNASASTLSLHHCLMARFAMRGPQFEANDMRKRDRYAVEMEAVNNVVFDFEHSGSRYSCGVESGNGTASDHVFRFQFLNNLYIGGGDRAPPIEAITRHGVIPNVKVHASGNILLEPTAFRWISTGPGRLFPSGKGAVVSDPGTMPAHEATGEKRREIRPPFWTAEEDSPALRAQLADQPLFRTSVTDSAGPAEAEAERVLREAGCNAPRDATDRRVLEDVARRRFLGPRHAAPRD